MPAERETKSPSAPSRAGRRPGGTGDLREALLRAARHLFATEGYEAVSVKRLAEAAEATPAMVNYYFGDKQGLYQAVVEQTLQPFIGKVRQMLEHAETPRLDDILAAYMRLVAANPWMPRLVMREVLAADGKFRERFINQVAMPGRGLLAETIRRGQEAGELRADLDPAFTAMSMMSMAVFPFAALPVTSSVFGVRLKDEVLERLIDNTRKILRAGVSA